MAPAITADSSSSSESDSSGSESDPRTASKSIPRVDFTASSPKVSRRKPSAKVKENAERDNAAKDARVLALQKQVTSMKKKLEKSKAETRERDADGAPPESEEEDDVEMSSFSGSFVSKGIASQTAPKTAPRKLRKSGEAPITTPMSRIPLSDLQDNGNALPGSDDIVHDDRDVEPDDGLRTPRPPAAAHKRARSSSPRRPRKKHRSRAAEPLPQAEFVGGRPPGGSRTNLKDFAEPARKLLKAALHRYEARIGTINPYPSAELQMQWAKEIWDEVCTEAGERMQLTERMASMMTKYGAHARSAVVSCVRPLIAPTYGFKVGDSEKILRKNSSIYKRLLEESGFHYEDTTLRTGYAKNPIILESIRVTWFKNKSGHGVLFVESFSPITLVTLAIIFTAIEFCIEEYSTGRFQQAMFDEAQNKDRFDVHLKDLTDWAALKPSVTDVVRQRMHDKLRASTGAALVKPTGRMTDAGRARALQELEAMNVEDDEGEGAEDDD
ncbi:hypothetical protein C8R46DRAFT_1268186 [Mycena filopes]|nr:hypothetical protein C8R46DRAFT_1268186 [Mycena filopes]